MPLSAAGKKILHNFEQEYGEKEGKSHFYAKENKGGKFARIVRAHKKRHKKMHS